MHILSGRARYVETMTDGEAGIVKDYIYGPGDSIVTPPLNPHAMEFLEDTVLICCSKNARNFDTYMADIVRVKLI